MQTKTGLTPAVESNFFCFLLNLCVFGAGWFTLWIFVWLLFFVIIRNNFSLECESSCLWVIIHFLWHFQRLTQILWFNLFTVKNILIERYFAQKEKTSGWKSLLELNVILLPAGNNVSRWNQLKHKCTDVSNQGEILEQPPHISAATATDLWGCHGKDKQRTISLQLQVH